MRERTSELPGRTLAACVSTISSCSSSPPCWPGSARQPRASPAQLLAEALRPVGRRCSSSVCASRQTSEAISLIEESVEPDLGGVADVSEAAELAARGSTLDTRTLMHDRAHDRGRRDARAGRSPERDDIPALIELVAGIDTSLLSIAEEIGRAVEEDGSDLRDSASPELRRLRRELRDGRGRLAERLRKIARDPALAEYLQDDFVTERGGRPVLALRASARGRVPGIVHDSSGSGQTLFVEPLAAVDDSNRLREAEVAERDEVTRILRNLSSLVGCAGTVLWPTSSPPRRASTSPSRAAASRAAGAARVVTAEPRRRAARSAPSAARPGDGRPDRPRARRAPRARDQRAEHRRQDRGAEDARARRRPPPVRSAAAGRRGCAARLRRDPRRHRRRAVDRDEPVDVLGPRAESRRHPRERDRARPSCCSTSSPPAPTRSRVRRSPRRCSMRSPAQARLTVTTSHYAELKEWASATERRRERRHRDRPRDATSRSTPSRSAVPGRRTLCRPPSDSVFRRSIVAAAREQGRARAAAGGGARRRGGGSRTGGARGALAPPRRSREEAEAARAQGAERRRRAPGRDREGARVGRGRAPAGAGGGRGGARRVRAELEELRAEIRAARKLERERGRATTPAAQKKEAERDRRLGAAAERAVRASRALVPARRAACPDRAARSRRSGGRGGASASAARSPRSSATRRPCSVAAVSACACRVDRLLPDRARRADRRVRPGRP